VPCRIRAKSRNYFCVTPVEPPIVPARLIVTWVASVPVRLLTKILSMPAPALIVNCSMSLRSNRTVPTFRITCIRPPFGDTLDRLFPEIFGWVGATEIVPGIVLDAPSTLVWEHENGVRAVLDITFAPDMYFRSDYYTGDERVEVTGRSGFVRLNRISARGIQEPSVEVYREGEIRGYHALPDGVEVAPISADRDPTDPPQRRQRCATTRAVLVEARRRPVKLGKRSSHLVAREHAERADERTARRVGAGHVDITPVLAHGERAARDAARRPAPLTRGGENAAGSSGRLRQRSRAYPGVRSSVVADGQQHRRQTEGQR